MFNQDLNWQGLDLLLHLNIFFSEAVFSCCRHFKALLCTLLDVGIEIASDSASAPSEWDTCPVCLKTQWETVVFCLVGLIKLGSISSPHLFAFLGS